MELELINKPLRSVYTADSLVPFDPLEVDGPWTLQPHLKWIGLTDGLSPTIGQATFVWEFGDEARPDVPFGEPEQAMTYVAPVELVGKFVCCTIPDREITWYGQIRDDGASDWAQEEYGDDLFRIFGGSQFFTAYDMKYPLARTIISGKSTRAEDRGQRPIGYNTGAGSGRSSDTEKKGNRSDAGTISGLDPPFAESTLYAFSFDDDAVDWTAWDSVVHLLAEQCPRDKDDEPAPLSYWIHDDSKPFLDWYEPSVEIEGRSLFDILNDVIDLRRGLTWRLEIIVDPEDEEKLLAVIHVSSITPGSLSLPDGELLPAAPTQVSIDDPNELDLSEPIQYSRNNVNRWHRVRSRGARRTTTASFVGASAVGGLTGYDFAIAVNSRINKTWSTDDEEAYWQGARPTLEPAEQTAYDALASEPKGEQQQADINDRFRQKQRFERVYRMFSVDAISAEGMELSPEHEPSTGSVIGDTPAERRALRLLNTTPMLVGYAYTNAEDPEGSGDDEFGKEFVAPFMLVHLRSGAQFVATTLGEAVDGGELDDSTTDGNWRFAAKLNSNGEKGFDVGDGADMTYEKKFPTNFSLKILNGEPGFTVTSVRNSAHALCSPQEANIYEDEAPSRYPRMIAWQSSLITGAAEWEAYCEAIWPVDLPVDLLAGTPVEELLIDLGDRARYDYLAKGTVYDIDAKGHLLQVEQGGALRDDRKLCETIARLAYLWYGPDRSEAAFAFHGIQRPWELGTLITTVGQGDAQKTVNAVVSQISINVEDGGTRITCNFPEVDFESFA